MTSKSFCSDIQSSSFFEPSAQHCPTRFGFSGLAGRVLLDDLSKMSLPMPAVSILWPEVLSENFKLLNQRYPMHEADTSRSLVFHGISLYFMVLISV